MQVNFDKGAVEWSVNGAVRATAANERLRDKTVKWVPFLGIVKQSVATIVG